MTQTSTNKPFDLEDRTLKFSQRVIVLIKMLPVNELNGRLTDQLLRSATSIGANYLEANDSLGKKDFVFRLRISRKEAKEAVYWLNLLFQANQNLKELIYPILKEAQELKNILSAIINNSV